MFDFSHLPQNAILNEYVFKVRNQTAAVGRHPYVWNKPPNCKLVFIIAIGGGGGGSGGVSGLSGTSRNGGGGGGGGAIAQALFLASSLPSTLYVYPYGLAGIPISGRGGASDTAGEYGVSLSITNYVTTQVGTPTPMITFLTVSGGNGGTTTAAGAASPTYTQPTSSILSNASIYATGFGGPAGTWVANGLPANTSIGTGLPILGGSGGGGVLTGTPTVFNGAGFTSDIPAILPDIAGGIASSALDATSGVRLPFVSVGGTGGGGNDNGPGGRGGNGVGYGAGGGGGGAGVTGNGGRGGDGGPAYACIIAW